ncbi:c-type cytochrome [Noviherbaspirillum sp. UKPF54]|uniref:c-type cytochrome n=1 Tax=Noviherbaspirillum sp. UKPF54 TaxID=2601898 RepID=UPI0011B18B1D|nr:c-type cytochrome [Noviherbaspirillum sp. UKPF54]QDZ27702.1 c-type cytochrome [Noviherbaspirillum sp. UKPF54]
MKLNTITTKLFGIAAATVALSLSASAFAAMSESDVEPYLKKQGCFKCHAIDKTKKGPSYKKVAEKYKGKPDGESKVIKNITTSPKVKLEDGTEEDHKVIETKDQGDLKAISNWILSR